MTRLNSTLSLLLILFSCLANAQAKKITRTEYIQTYADLAISEMKRSKIPASITLAQGCLESSDGNSVLAKKANNHFGIKCKGNWNGKTIRYDDDTKNECFRKYSHVKESYKDHTDFLVQSPRYASLFSLEPTNYIGWALGLKKAGYATDQHYAEKLIRIIEDNKLHQYDIQKNGRETAHTRSKKSPKATYSSATLSPGSKERIKRVNNLNAIVVKAGESLQSISKDFGLKDWELQTYNDYPPERILRENEILYIEAKRKKADKKHLTHIADAGDSMHFISQRYGIRLKPLLRRNHMKYGENPNEGQVIYLRKKKPKTD